jgi:hypothetical protein
MTGRQAGVHDQLFYSFKLDTRVPSIAPTAAKAVSYSPSSSLIPAAKTSPSTK